MKKTNFIIFAIFFLAIVIWVGIYAWDSINQDNVSAPPSSVNLDEITRTLEELELNSEIDFSLVESKEFKWIKEGEDLTIEGKGFEAKNISNEEYNRIESFLLTREFELDAMNIASGTVSGLAGYRKDNIVCVVVGGFSGYENAPEDWVPVDDTNDVKVSCGEIE